VKAIKQGDRRNPRKAGTKSFRRSITVSIIVVSIVGLAAAGLISRNHSKQPTVSPSVRLPKSPRTPAELLALKPADLEGTDIALMNLLCSEGLPGAEDVNIDACLSGLDQWAERVKAETLRNYHQFQKDRKYFYNSESFYKMLMLAVIVYEDMGVRYNPKWIASPSQIQENDHFFADSRDVLIHGILGGRRMGTCSSMPVLYIALGRRLGYPLKLVTAKQHLFFRWDSPTEKFNMEATGRGLDKYDDAHFKQWPLPITEQEIKEQDYLKSLSSAEELSVFLSIRGMCLTEAGRFADATAAYNAAHSLAPNWKGNQVLLAEAQQRQQQPTTLAARRETRPKPPTISAEPNPMQQIQNSMRNP
jgi:hypothetical protein